VARTGHAARKTTAAQHTDDAAEEATASSGRLIKYMGASHNRVLEKGETFGGRLPGGLPQRVEWNFANNHLVNSDDVGLSSAAVGLLLEIEGEVFNSGQWEDAEEEGYVQPTEENTLRTVKEFQDVTGQETVAPSLAQQIFLGMSEHQTSDDAIRAMERNIAPANPAATSTFSPAEQTFSVSQDASEDGLQEAAVADGAQQSGSPGEGANTTTVGGSTGETSSGPTTTVGGSTDGAGTGQ